MPPTASPRAQGLEQQSASQLLALPEPLLLAVLQCLAAADDHRSLCSVAQAHSRLHQAAVAALGSSITVRGIQHQEQMYGVLLYLSKHGQHMNSVELAGLVEADDDCFERPQPPATLHQLPPIMQLHSLELIDLYLQLRPRNGWQGVLGYAAGVSALKQLRLHHCVLLDGNWGLAQLPTGLEHLSFARVRDDDEYNTAAAFPTSVLQQLQQLTHLELAGVKLLGPDRASPALQPLQALSRLADLRLADLRLADLRLAFEDESSDEFIESAGGGAPVLTASMLSCAAGLTRLELQSLEMDPGTLAGKTRLQHLAVDECRVPREAERTALLQLESLQRLTHLNLTDSLCSYTAPVTAYSALTASSKLRHLCLSKCLVLAGVWQHVFPAGRQLPHLTSLVTSWVQHVGTHGSTHTAVPEGSRLVSCCPGLLSLDVRGLVYSAGAFRPLSGLHTLTLTDDTGEALREVCQLTGLRDLEVYAYGEEEVLLHTTQLRRLTRLEYDGPLNGRRLLQLKVWSSQAPDDEPVWRQVLRAHLNHSNPAVVQQAAAALAGAQ